MVRKLVSVVSILGATALGAVAGPVASSAGPGSASRDPAATGCPTGRAGIAVSRPGAERWVSAGGRLVGVNGAAAAPAVTRSAEAGAIVRHVTTVEGVGTAFVEDAAGGDTVVLETEGSVVRIPQHTEAVNPALSREGDLAWSVGSAIRVRDARTGAIRRLPVPVDGARAFSPVFPEGRGLVVVLSAPPTPSVPEDEWSNDLWRVSPGGTWRRATAFEADADRWAAVRTPVASRGGGVEFVLVRGRGSATVEPRFALMHLGPGGVQRREVLDGERYLAGPDGLWNVPDLAAERIDLVRELADGSQRTIGCGATLMDPIDVADPDRAQDTGGSLVPERAAPAVETHAGGSVTPDGGVGILVGDFATPAEAELAVAAIRGAFGEGAPVRVIDGTTAPHALRPGAYGAILQLGPDQDPAAALAAFRATLPAYVSSSWVVSA